MKTNKVSHQQSETKQENDNPLADIAGKFGGEFWLETQSEIERSPKIKRIGTQDCRIAAIAHANKFTIVTVNVNDFVSIGLTDVEDWTR